MYTRNEEIIHISRRLAAELDRLSFSEHAVVYNPLVYARSAHEEYLRRFVPRAAASIFVGMNAGPWGMAQTGIPFGAVPFVRDWLCISEQALRAISAPACELSSKPVRGIDTTRNEVSGMRFWSLVRDCYPRATDFFKEHFVINYCPLLFTHTEGRRNITPDKLPPRLRSALFEICDSALAETLLCLETRALVAVGGFAAKRLQSICTTESKLKDLKIVQILHPSPANPQANKNWAERVRAQLAEAGIFCN